MPVSFFIIFGVLKRWLYMNIVFMHIYFYDLIVYLAARILADVYNVQNKHIISLVYDFCVLGSELGLFMYCDF